MKKSEFFEEVADIFELEEEVNEETAISVDSLALLSLIALFDENFGMSLTGGDVKKITKVCDLITIAGSEKFS